MKKIKTSPLLPKEFVVEQISANEANIIAYPFETGFAVSLAHPLRRFLLSSSVGYAPIGIKIEGAKHEFDSVRGMLEDISDFIINLKGVRFKLKNGLKDKEVSYSFAGPCEIRGSDLDNDDVEVVTPNAFLATLNEDATLNFTVKIHQGIGYVPSEDVRDSLGEGYIALDAFFTPVRRATYTIENVLVEDNPNFEKVVINIMTDGQISPVDAFKNALEVMYAQMAVFNSEVSIKAPVAADRADEHPELKRLGARIEELGLSARSFNCLDRSNIKYIGEKSFEEILEKINEYGYSVGQELPDDLVNAIKKKIEAE